ncbi:MAG: bifunctional YncE family protein/alkaline phosphatase family protein, partial [Fimbriiglobus sp.]
MRNIFPGAAAIALGLALAALPVTSAEPPPIERVLPGLRPDGFVQLPNQWKLNPVGRQIDVGDLPMNVQLHPTGQFAAVLHCGMKDHEVLILDLNPKRQKVACRVTVDQSFYGLAFGPDGKQVYASGGEFDVVHVWDFDKGLLHNHRTIDVSAGRRTVPAGLTLDPAGRELFAAAMWAEAVIRVPLDNPANKIVIPLGEIAAKPPAGTKGEPPSPPDNRKEPGTTAADAKPKPLTEQALPYAVLVDPAGKRAFVSLWAKAAVAVIDLETNTVTATWPTASHPTELVLSPDGKALYVACANSTKVTVLDPATGDPLQTINAALYPQAPVGNTPNSLALTPDGEMLFVANADANNLAVFNVADPKVAKPLGFVPTGWFPTSVRFNKLDKSLYVANGKGLSSKPNRSGPVPTNPRSTLEYIGALFPGTVSVVPAPGPTAMAKYTKTAYECSPLQRDAEVRAAGVAADNPIPRKVGDPSPIKHVIYVIKENRTYDQVFGDMKEGNG